MLETLETGLYSTIQDGGRPGVAHLGVRPAGAADELALAVANLLVGDAPGSAVLEMTLLGGTFAVRAPCLVGLAGADMEALLLPERRPLRPGHSYWLRSGGTLRLGAAVDGARTYLAMAGGIEADVVMGSASTDPIAGFGGIGGRALAVGDMLTASPAGGAEERSWPATVTSSGVAPDQDVRRISVVRGPHLDQLPRVVAGDLTDRTWLADPQSDRVGVRLDGEGIAGADTVELVSQPMLPGAVQLPPRGRPIVLMPDAPTIGGYPVPAVVAAIDRPTAAQLRPGDRVGFDWVEPEEARTRYARRAQDLRAVAASWT